MADERDVVRRFTRADLGPDGSRVLKVGAVVAVVTFALVLGAWRIVMADLPSFGDSAARAAVPPAAAPTTPGGPSETFVVPVPSFVTPSLTTPLGPLVPEVVETTAPEPAPAAPAPSAAAPPATPQPNQVRSIDLACNQNKNRIVATLSFFSAEPVTVTLNAGQHSESSRQRGAVRMRVAGQAGTTPTCSAVVDGRQVGPIRG